MAVRQRKKSKNAAEGKPTSMTSSGRRKANNKGHHNNNGAMMDTPTSNGRNGKTRIVKWTILAVLVVMGSAVSALLLFSDILKSSSSSSSSSSSVSSGEKQAASTVHEGSSTHSPTDNNVPSSSPSSTSSPTTQSPSSNTPTEQVDSSSSPPSSPSVLYTKRGSYKLLKQYPHDPKAFCQGLEVKNATHLYASIGLYGQSAMRIVETTTGRVTRETIMPEEFFGEGVTLVRQINDEYEDESFEYLLQLTWKEKTAFLYHPETLEEMSRMPYETTNTQGWGMAFDTHQKNIVYVTDGTMYIHTWKLVWDEVEEQLSYEQIARNPVTLTTPQDDGNSRNLKMINELEYDPHTRTLLANVWFENALIRIDPATGFILRIYDFSSIYTNRDAGADVFNGVAVLPDQPGHLYVTGKLWPSLYHVELVDFE